jgi:hypothetical protein
MERQHDYMRDKSSWDDPLADQPVEHWDEDDFANLDDIQFRTASTASSTASWQHTQPSHIDRRDSILSRLSARSDRGSNQDDQEWDVVVDQPSVNDAVAIAKRTGIPIPTNVPQSALIGGTIRKMPGKKIKQAMSEDWTEDLDFDGPLRLRSTSNPLGTPSKNQAYHEPDGFDDDFEFPPDGVLKTRQVSTKLQATPSRPPPNDKDDFGDGFDLPSDGKFGAPRLPIQIQAPTPRPRKLEADDFEADFELPKDGILKRRQPSTPLGALHQPDDLDLEWAEGSLGTRNAGTRRDGRSNRSSSASAFSPSMSSAITESEDEGLDGLILPAGPLRFEEILKKRQENQSPDAANYSGERNAAKRAAAKDDFFSGIEVGDGDIFDTGKLTLNRNIKHKIQRQTSPARRPATTLTFTNNKPGPTISRLPRFQATKDRARPTLEPVSESGNAVSRYRRPESRAIGHTAQSSTSSIPTPSPPSAPSTPSRRGLRTQESHDQIRYDAPTTTSTQLLRAKRSMPVMRNLNSPSKLSPYPRPSSRNNDGVSSRLHIPSRPKTPTDRAESRLGDARRPPVPFLPAGASTTQSQHVSIKSTTTRHYRRNDSDGSNDGSFAGMRSHSRLAYRPETPGRGGTVRGSLTPAELAAAAKKTITKPTRRRNFGDGNELDIFDDLPTSASTESKFIKQPVGRGAPRSLRSRLGQSHIGNSTTSLSTRGGAETPMPITPLSPNKPELNIPRFARDTAASRIAREQRQVSTTYNPRENARGPLTPISDNWKAHIAARPNLHAPSSRKRGGKVQQKPHLIKPIGDGHLKEPKSVKGMQYNPLTFKWEGNENELEPFEIPAFHPPSSPDGSPNSKPPALITNVGQAGGVQVVGEMVFDPRRMCWLKMAPTSMARDGRGPDSGGVSSVQLEDEEDVFAGLEDLKEEDETGRSSYGGAGGGLVVRAGEGVRQVSGTTNGDGSGDELGPVLGEEFDVGPEFIRRQRAEEEKWRRKVEGWLRAQESMHVDVDVFSGWRWQIREIVNSTASG